jgi:uncharacterized protein YbaP (TraB family)
MNNIVIYLICLLIIPASAAAESNLSDACKDYRSVLDVSDPVSSGTQDIPFKTGMLWQIKSPQGKINYLFGTMHSQDYAVSTVPKEVSAVLQQSDVFIMETVPGQAANQTFLDMMVFKEGQQLDNFLADVVYEELVRQIQDYGVPREQVIVIKPWAAFSLIGRPKPIRAPTLEDNLLQIARQNGLEIKSLETMEEILSALDTLPIEDQIIILTYTVCNHEQIIRDSKDLVSLYVHRDLAGITEYNNQTHYDEAVFDRFMQGILYDRNSRMLQRIENEFTAENIFVAVGASHLAGEEGLLQQLSEKGFAVTAIY